MNIRDPTIVLGVEIVAPEPSFEGKMLKEAVFRNGKADTGAT